MTDEAPLTPREELTLRILARAGGPYALATPTTDLPLLGPSFASRVATQFEVMKRFRASFMAQIGALSDEDLAKHFDRTGNPLSNEGKLFSTELREVVAKANETVWEELALRPDLFRPDFTTWGARTELTLEEVTLLSVGLEPTPRLIKAIDGSRPPGDGQTDEAGFLFKRFIALGQWVEHQHRGGKIPITSLGPWFAKTGLPMAAGFVEMIQRVTKPAVLLLEKSPEVTDQTKAEPAVNDESIEVQPVDPREKQSMAKLICAMAIDFYGYDPTAARSPIPTEIQGVADRYGISISINTIRSYLREGAEHLAPDWKEAQLAGKTSSKRNKLKK